MENGEILFHPSKRYTNRRVIYSTQRLEENTYIKLNSGPSRSSCKTAWPEEGARCATKRIRGCICSTKESPTASTCSKICKLERKMRWQQLRV